MTDQTPQAQPQAFPWRHEIGDFVTIAIDPTQKRFEVVRRGFDLYGADFYGLKDHFKGTAFIFNLGFNCILAAATPQENLKRELIKDWSVKK